MDFTVSQFHSFTKRQGGWGKNRGQGSGVRDQKDGDQGNEGHGSGFGLLVDHGTSMRRKG
jgi:hypothetical protein